MEPKWRRDGRELYFLGLDAKLMAVPIKAASVFEAGQPAPLFQTPFTVPGNPSFSYYDVTADGRQFLMITPVGSSSGETNSPPITVVLNWLAALRKK